MQEILSKEAFYVMVIAIHAQTVFWTVLTGNLFFYFVLRLLGISRGYRVKDVIIPRWILLLLFQITYTYLFIILCLKYFENSEWDTATLLVFIGDFGNEIKNILFLLICVCACKG